MTAFPISMTNPAEHAGALPDWADVVVIGGGVIGVSTALFLARAGLSVVLLEKGRIAGEQSARNWGWIRVQGRDPGEIPIAQEAQRLWRTLAPELDVDIGLVQGGVAYLARDEAELSAFSTWMAHAEPFGVTTRLLGRAETAALLPAAEHPWPGAMWTPTDMRAEPFVAVPALARLAARAGAVVREGTAVRGLDLEAGAVRGVMTEHGPLRAGAVVLAGGAWSSLFLRRHGVRIPQLSVRASVLRTAPMAQVFPGGAVDHRLAFRRRADGGYTLAPEASHELFVGPDAVRAAARFLPILRQDPFGTRLRPAAPRGYPDAWMTPRRWKGDAVSPFERMRVLDPAPNRRSLRAAQEAFEATFPALGPVTVAAAWAGMIDTLPDLVPVVDHVAALPGLVVATGMSGHGFGIGPGFGRVIADLVQGQDPGHDLSRFRLSRFFDGTRLELGPSL